MLINCPEQFEITLYNLITKEKIQDRSADDKRPERNRVFHGFDAFYQKRNAENRADDKRKSGDHQNIRPAENQTQTGDQLKIPHSHRPAAAQKNNRSEKRHADESGEQTINGYGC